MMHGTREHMMSKKEMGKMSPEMKKKKRKMMLAKKVMK